MRIKKHTKFTTLVALIATLVCALVAGVTLLAMPKTVMTANAEEEPTVYDSMDAAITVGAVTKTESDGKVNLGSSKRN